MPNQSIARLTKDSGDAQVQAAISDCIATEVKGGRPQDQAVAMCYEMARKQTGGRPAAPEEGE